jgi:hypothetical protein
VGERRSVDKMWTFFSTTNKKGPPFGEPLSLNLGAAPGVENINNYMIYKKFVF